MTLSVLSRFSAPFYGSLLLLESSLSAFCGLLIRHAFRSNKESNGEGDSHRARRPGEAAPSATRRPRRTRTSRLRPPPGKRTDGHARARDAQSARLSAPKWRVFWRINSASCGAQAARLVARKRRVLWRVAPRFAARYRLVSAFRPALFSESRPARLSARYWRVLRRAPDASFDA